MIGVHRFHDRVAVNPPDGPTLYLEREDAEKLALLLLECTADIYARNFQHSQFPATNWNPKAQ